MIKQLQALELIEAHKLAVAADEAMFDDDGNCIDATGADGTEQSERQAFIALVDAPCHSSEEMAAKVDYFLNGTIGERSTLIEYLTEYGDGSNDLHRRLLQSLVVKS